MLDMKKLSTNELRELYQQFFEEKRHARISSAPLVPENDPSVLFTTAGMHPLVPYLKGQPHPAGKRLVNVQKCLRTTDIDEVGDASHGTVFEMLGNWSLGDYFKEKAITLSWEFLTKQDWLGIDPDYLAVSVFGGDENNERDQESYQIWKSLGLTDERIVFLDKKENWWPAGGKAPGPQGPDTEMFFWTGKDSPPKEFDPNNTTWVEIWNDVFMEFNRNDDGEYEPLPQQNVDTGMGLERTVMVLNGLDSIYKIDSYQKLMKIITSYRTNTDEKQTRILADHIKAATFVLGDERPVVPSKSEQGYVLRRIIRRAVRAGRLLGIENINEVMRMGAEAVLEEYQAFYPSLMEQKEMMMVELAREIDRFKSALDRGLKELDKTGFKWEKEIPGETVFRLYESYGFPIELTEEIAKEKGLGIDKVGFEKALEKHKEVSRTATSGKFSGGLADHSEQSVRYHTATHLLHQALKDVLGTHIKQRGSNITPERLRFDFMHDVKMTPEQIQQVEEIINEKIKESLIVKREEMTVEQAKEVGAVGLFGHKYGEKISMYTIGDYSKEICGGPHVKNTKELGLFKIKKEESAGAGIRRIKAILT
jgi:alanyl-tRNA synthetase